MSFKFNPFTGNFDEVSAESPGGVDGNVQFNNSGVFGGDDDLFWDDTNKRLGIGINTPLFTLDVDGTINIPSTTSTSGVIYQDGSRFIHTYKSEIANGKNLFIGFEAGNFTMSGTSSTYASSNTGIGYLTLHSLTTGYFNTAIGTEALRYCTTGNGNTAMGNSALRAITTGDNNLSVGTNNLPALKTGNDNYAYGAYNLYKTSSGTGNIAIGRSCLHRVVSGGNNIGIGKATGVGVENQSDFNYAVLMGYYAGAGLMTGGDNNIFLGKNAGLTVTTGADNIIIGVDADLVNTTDSNKLNIGNTLYGDLSNGLIGVGTESPEYALDVYDTTTGINSWIGLNFKTVGKPDEVVGVASTGTELEVGTYDYLVTYITAVGETNGYTERDVVTTAGNQQITLTLPISTDPRVIGRKIYRSVVDGSFYNVSLVDTIDNEVTTYVDSTPDADLPAETPYLYYKDDTTSKFITVNDVSAMSVGTVTTFGVEANYNGTGAYATFIGYNAGKSNTGFASAGLGYQVLSTNTGFGSVGVGYRAGFNNTGGNLTAIGYASGYTNSGATSSFIGYYSGNANSGKSSTAVGYASGQNNSGGRLNALGYKAGYGNGGSDVVALGYQAGYDNIGTHSIFIGQNAGYENADAYQFIIKDATANTLPLLQGNMSTGALGIHMTTPTARLHLPVGTTTLAPLKLTAGTALTTPETGAIEFHDNRFYITNKALRKAVDRTSDVKLSTTTVAATTTETTVFTASVPANSWVAGNALKLEMFGKITNTVANDQVTIKVKVDGTEIASVQTTGRKLTDNCWIVKGAAIIRTVGESGTMAWIMDIHVAGQDKDYTCDVVTNDTTGSLDITVTATWSAATTGDSFLCTGGWMEYKN